MASKKTPTNVSGRKGKESTAPMQFSSPRHQLQPIWPEWSDQEVNTEKWDSAQKAKEKGKSPSTSGAFVDPEGVVLLPPSLQPACTKRPSEFLLEKTPVVYDPEMSDKLDLLYYNEHLFKSETMRHIICEIQNLWLAGTKKRGAKAEASEESPYESETGSQNWRPWEHIYAMTKVGKETNSPQYNPFGKYAVKLFWMGAWRKILVDDQIPFNGENEMLLPCSRQPYELWPMLLSKALLKVASLDYGGGIYNAEYGDFSPTQCLTGWLKHTVIIRNKPPELVWSYLCQYLQPWKRQEKRADERPKLEAAVGETEEKSSCGKEVKSGNKEKSKDKKGTEKAKDTGKDKKETGRAANEESLSKIPEAMIFISHGNMMERTTRFLPECSNTGERVSKLSRLGFTRTFSYPIVLSKRRSIPLIPPNPPKPVPSWKLIRPKPADFPKSPEEIKDEEAKEKEPIRSVLLWTPVQELVFREPTELLPETTQSPSPSRKGSAWVPENLEKSNVNSSSRPSGTKRRSVGGHKSVGSVSSNSTASRNQKQTSQEEGKKKPGTGKTRETKSSSRTTESGDAKSIRSLREDSFRLSLPPHEEEKQPEQVVQSSVVATQPKEFWVDIKDLCELFNVIDIYHKPGSYPIVRSQVELKMAGMTMDRGSPDGQYLFVDSICPSEVILNLSAVCRWPPPQGKEYTSGCSRGISLAPDVEDILNPADQARSAITVQNAENYPIPGINASQFSEADATLTVLQPPPPATIIVEKKRWLDSCLGEPVKRLDVTGSRSLSLLLPRGRHVLKIIVYAPLGYTLTALGAIRQLPGEGEGSTANEKEMKMVGGEHPVNVHCGEHQRPHVVRFTLQLGDCDTILTTGLTTEPLCIREHANRLIECLYQYGCSLVNSVNPEEWPTLPLVSKHSTKDEIGGHLTVNSLQTPNEEIFRRSELYLQSYEKKYEELRKLLSDKDENPSADGKPLGTVGYRRALLSILQDIFNSQQDGMSATPDMNFAWRIMNSDLSSDTPLHASYAPQTSTVLQSPSTAKQKSKSQSSRVEKLSNVPAGKSASDEPDFSHWKQPQDPRTLIAIVRIQSVFRGHRARLMLSLRDPKNIVSLVLLTKPEYNFSPSGTGFSSNELGLVNPSTNVSKRLLDQAKRAVEGWMKCMEAIQKAHAESEVGLELVRCLIRGKALGFGSDLVNYVNVCEYTGSYGELSAPVTMQNTTSQKDLKSSQSGWLTFLFRDILQVPRMGQVSSGSSLISMDFKHTLVGSRVHMIDNDTYREVEISAEGPAHWLTLKSNQRGYSLLCVAGAGPAPGGHWRLRMTGPGIDGADGLPKSASGTTLCTNFHTAEIADYYIPNPKCLLFKRKIEVRSEQLISLHLRLSAPDVPVRLLVTVGGETVIESSGTGETQILVLLVRSNQKSLNGSVSSTEKDEGNKLTEKATPLKLNVRTPPTRRSPPTKKSARGSRHSSSSSRGGSSDRRVGVAARSSVSPRVQTNEKEIAETPRIPEMGPSHQKENDGFYWIEAYVDSSKWPLSLRNWSHLRELRRAQLEEYLVAIESRSASTGRTSARTNPRERRPPKSAVKAPSTKDKSSSRLPQPNQLDLTQAHWQLRMICDAAAMDQVTICKPDDRSAEIRMMKRAWEEMEPGRAERAALSRSRYLQAQLEKVRKEDTPVQISDVIPERPAKSQSASPGSSRPRSKSSRTAKDTAASALSDHQIVLEEDPGTIYTLQPPPGMFEPNVQLEPLDINAFYSNPEEVERERCDTCAEEMGIPLEPWYIGLEYLQALQETDKKLMDFTLLERLKQTLFNKVIFAWEQSQQEHKMEWKDEKMKHIWLLKELQLLSDQLHANYYESCEAYRRQLVDTYRKAVAPTSATPEGSTVSETPSKRQKKGRSPGSSRQKKSPGHSAGRKK